MSTDLFRRFTYRIPAEHLGISELLAPLQSEVFQQQLKTFGLQAFELYGKGDTRFLVIDGAADMNSASLADTLSVFPPLSDLQGILQNVDCDFSFGLSPLERIYELDQQMVYPSEEGQLKTDIGPKKRFVWTLFLQEDPELIATYKKIHGIGQAWPEITANMKSIGVKDMEIYLYQAQAFLIMDTKPDFDLEKIGPHWQKLPLEKEWQEYVGKFQRTNPQNSIQEKWESMIPL